MATREELLNQAVEIRDAETENENTALRVGTLLVDIVEYLSGVIDADDMEDILADYAQLAGDGLVNWQNSRCVFLASMGAELDNIDGGNWEYASHNGDIIFDPSLKSLRVVGESGNYYVRIGVAYINAHSGHAYKWDNVARVMTEITDSSRPTVITYRNPPLFGSIAIGESYYYEANETKRLAIKTSANGSYSFTPDPKKIYVFKDIREGAVWDSANSTWLSIGGAVDVITSLNSDDSTKALAASSGAVLKQAIITLFNSLSNSAFSIGRPTLVWTTPQTFNVTRTLSHCSLSNTSNTATEGNPFSAVLTAERGYSLKSSGASVVVTMGGTDVTSNVFNAATGEIAIASVNGNIVITATAAETTNIQIAYNIFGVTKGNSPTEIEENEDLEVVLTKGSDWNSYADSAVDLAARDILVYVNGKYLERKLNQSDSDGDFTATKSGDAVTINVPKEKITGNVVIMNIPWKAKYVCCKAQAASQTTSSPAQSAGEVRITTTNTSVYTNLFMPVPASCGSIEFRAYKNTDMLARYGVGTAFYDNASPTDDSADTSKPFVADSCVRGVGYADTARVVDLTSQTIPSEGANWDYAKSGATRADYVSFRSSFYTNTVGSTNVSETLNNSYIYDATNKKYIWFGNSVTKKTNR